MDPTMMALAVQDDFLTLVIGGQKIEALAASCREDEARGGTKEFDSCVRHRTSACACIYILGPVPITHGTV